ncbi:hypothetical protein C8R44DRAFT_893830 [Mycena epipterygia]|nr:hypothetical protein C8R44DRAFT_893830 [Mycena epipterygia]
MRTEILRGGKYVLFGDAQTLTSWQVSDDSLLGTYRSSVPSPSVCAFTAEALHDVEHANVVICIRSSVAANPHFVEVISWDFTTGMIELHCSTECTGSAFNNPKPICSGVAVVRTQMWGEEGYILINFRAQKYCRILCPSDFGSNSWIELIPGYFIFTFTASSDRTQEIRMGSIASLSSFWTLLGPHNAAEPLHLSDIYHLVSKTVKPNGGLIRKARIHMAVHESPLQRGTYRLWLRFEHSLHIKRSAVP